MVLRINAEVQNISPLCRLITASRKPGKMRDEFCNLFENLGKYREHFE